MEGSWPQSEIANAKSVAVSIAASGDNTVHIVTAGRRFIVWHLWLQAEAAVEVTAKSGSTAVSAPINFALNAEKEWKNAGLPVFKGRAVGENFILNLSGAFQVNGFALIGEMTA